MQLYLLCIFALVLYSSAEAKSILTFDEFFDATNFPYVSLSPTGEYLLVQTNRAIWNTDSYENSLWLYDVQSKLKRLITSRLAGYFAPVWSPSGKFVAFGQSVSSPEKNQRPEHYIYMYSIVSHQSLSIPIGQKAGLSVTWSVDDSSLYFYTVGLDATKEDEEIKRNEWKDVIQHRKPSLNDHSTIHCLSTDWENSMFSPTMTSVTNISFPIGSLLYVPFEEQLVFTSTAVTEERLEDFEIYSVQLRNVASIKRLTNNTRPEERLKLSADGKHLLFILSGDVFEQSNSRVTQSRLFSLDLSTGQVERIAKDFTGNILGYTIKSDGGLYILGLLGTETQIYSQRSSDEKLIFHRGHHGTYELLSSAASSCSDDKLAYVYSSFQQPKEVYLIDSIGELAEASPLTNENQILADQDLPQGDVYQWQNSEDQRTVEGVLHYPPGKFRRKNLPLLVLIHGGPNSASINAFRATWYTWAPLAASLGWLVLEPNYRGSTGYGDEFLNELSLRPLSRPGTDILSGVDRLIKDGIVDPKKLAVAGYSYGGYLTNWLITQTTRFNVALTGAGASEHVSSWGTFDIPTFLQYLFGGYPWETGNLYQNESAVYHLGKATTPTLIVTGDADTRVVPGQSYILERGLHYLGVPVQLLVFPNEPHGLTRNPWHGKIKVREELKWLQKYGQQRWMKKTEKNLNESIS